MPTEWLRRSGSSCAETKRTSHEDVQGKQRAHQQVGHVHGLADAQIDCHAAKRVGLLAGEAPSFEVVYHVEQGVLGREAQVLALVGAVFAYAYAGSGEETARGRCGRCERYFARSRTPRDAAYVEDAPRAGIRLLGRHGRAKTPRIAFKPTPRPSLAFVATWSARRLKAIFSRTALEIVARRPPLPGATALTVGLLPRQRDVCNPLQTMPLSASIGFFFTICHKQAVSPFCRIPDFQNLH